VIPVAMLRFAIVFVCLILPACRNSGARMDPALTRLIPPDAVALAGARLDQLRTTPLYRKLAAQHRLPQFDQFSAETGIDPQRDVSELLFAHDGKHGLLMARGAFRGGRNRPDGSLVFLDQRIALAGPAAMVRTAIDQYRTGHASPPPALLARVPGDGQIWAASIGWPGLPPATLSEMGNAANLDRVLRAVADLSFMADFTSGVHAAATANCRTDQEASALAENLRALASLAHAGAPKNEPDLQRAFDAIQVRQDARAIKVTLDLPEDLAERLADYGVKH